jgi:hypothetical protein
MIRKSSSETCVNCGLPAAALRATQREYLAPGPETDENTVSAASTPGGPDDTWTSFILVGD